jgi:signal transduction histidine kinase
MKTGKNITPAPRTVKDIASEALPQFEQFIENREAYIKALEQTVEILRTERSRRVDYSLAVRSSVDELVAMQRMANSISTSGEPDRIARTLMDLARLVIPVLASNIFLFDASTKQLTPFPPQGTADLESESKELLEGGIIDWVLIEKRTVIIPDLHNAPDSDMARNFVIVPLFIRNLPVGIFLIHTEKPQHEFSNQDIQLLSVLANQAAAGVENWRVVDRLAQASDEIRISQAQMIQAAKLAALGELAASILHEIKNPLSIMKFHVDAARGGSLPGKTVTLIAEQITRINDISGRLMNFCREHPGDEEREPVDVNRAIEEIIAVVRNEFNRNSIEVRTSFSPQLPLILANCTYLQQVFLNLLNNARDAMPSGGRVDISTALTGTAIVITIADTGTGIPTENREMIFKPFFTTKQEGKGTGLGLSISSKIVAAHGGTLQVESTPGKGAAFTITIPTARQPRAPKQKFPEAIQGDRS